MSNSLLGKNSTFDFKLVKSCKKKEEEKSLRDKNSKGEESDTRDRRDPLDLLCRQGVSRYLGAGLD